MDPLSITASIAALIAVTQQIVTYLKDVKDGGEERDHLAKELASLLTLFRILESRVNNAQSEDVWRIQYLSLAEPVAQLKESIDRLQKVLAPQKGVNKLRQVLSWTSDKNEVQRILAEIERHKSSIDIVANQDHFELAKQTRGDVSAARQDLKRIQSDQEATLYLDLVNWLSPLNFFKKHDELISQTRGGTGKWMTESRAFENWISEPGTTLFCPGMPGAGKTFLASQAICKLQQRPNKQNSPVLFIYCNHKDQAEQTNTNLLASLLKQILQSRSTNTTIPESVLSMYQEQKIKDIRPREDQIINALEAELKGLDQAFVVVDALDECKEERDRLALLKTLQKLPSHCNLLIMSRPNERIRDTISIQESYCDVCDASSLFSYYACDICDFSDFCVCQSCYEDGIRECRDFSHTLTRKSCNVEFKIEARVEDIENYIEWRITQEPALTSCVRRKPELKDMIVAAIAGKAQGMFLLATLQMESIRTKSNPGALKRALDSLDSKLEGTYAQAIERIESQSEDEIEIAKRLLAWITCTFRPLSVSEIQDCMAVQIGDSDLDKDNTDEVSELTSLCAGLVIIDSFDVVRLVHYTTQEYFDENHALLFPDFHTNIAKTCLTYLSFDVFATGPCCGPKRDEEFDARLDEYPFLAYAAQYWGEHAYVSTIPDIKDAILDFLDRKQNLASCIEAIWYSDISGANSWNVRGGSSALHIAASFNLADVTMSLLDIGSDINSTDGFNNTALIYAAKRNCIAVVKLLLDRGAEVNLKSRRGSTALFEAVQEGYEEVVRCLMDRPDLDINAVHSTQHGRTALMLATFKSWDLVVSQLLRRHDIKVNQYDDQGNTALLYAALLEEPTILGILLTSDEIDPNLQMRGGTTPLMTAAAYGHEMQALLLLDKGANLELKDCQGGTALLRAIDENRVEMVKFLIKRGADVDALDFTERSMLHGATVNHRTEIMRLLLERGLNVNASGTHGETPLHDAARHGHLAATEILLEYNADTSIQDNTGQSPLTAAIQYGNTEVAKLIRNHENRNVPRSQWPPDSNLLPPDSSSLLSAVRSGRVDFVESTIALGVDVGNIDPIDGRTALHHATWEGFYDIVEALLRTPVPVNVQDYLGRTALHFAALRGDLRIGRLLVAHDANVNTQDQFGYTPLQLSESVPFSVLMVEHKAAFEPGTMEVQEMFWEAASSGNAVATKILLHRGADTQAKNSYGYTALQIAKSMGRTEIMLILREHKTFVLEDAAQSLALDDGRD